MKEKLSYTGGQDLTKERESVSKTALFRPTSTNITERRKRWTFHTIQQKLYTFDQLHVFGGNAGMKVWGANTPQCLLKCHVAKVLFVQGIDTVLIVALETESESILETSNAERYLTHLPEEQKLGV